MTADVFVSYRRTKFRLADRVRFELERLAFSVYLDLGGATRGTAWQPNWDHEIDGATNFGSVGLVKLLASATSQPGGWPHELYAKIPVLHLYVVKHHEVRGQATNG